jgi:DnaD/phage-associated family protein
MAEEYVLPQPETLTLSLREADKLISAGSGDAALLYLYILRNAGRLDPEKARQQLSLGDRLETAMGILQKQGLVRMPAGVSIAAPEDAPRRSPDQALPAYTVSDVRRAVDADGAFTGLLDETARLLGHVLSPGDMMTLFGLYDYLGLPPEVILLLISWCTTELERRFGPGRRPTMRQVEKEAYIWADQEILTLAMAEAHIAKLAEKRRSATDLRRRLGIRDRQLSPTEDKYVRSWIEMGFTPEAVEEAYDRTILKKKELVWPYINSILKNWHQRGLHTLQEILEGDPRDRSSAAKKTGDRASREGPDPAELERMQKFLNKLNGGEEHGD